ncbi:hypothetical protein D3C86_1179340 [compost metagenome]
MKRVDRYLPLLEINGQDIVDFVSNILYHTPCIFTIIHSIVITDIRMVVTEISVVKVVDDIGYGFRDHICARETITHIVGFVQRGQRELAVEFPAEPTKDHAASIGL